MDLIRLDHRPPRSQSYLITGASSGIGRALALQLASEQATRALGLVARRDELLMKLKQEINSLYPEVFVEYRGFDCTVTNKIPVTIAYFHNKLGPLNTVIVNHGLGNPKPHQLNGTFEPYENILNVNLVSNCAVVDAAIRYAEANRGEIKRLHLVVVSSLIVHTPLYASSAYYASKVGLEAYVEALKGNTPNVDFTIVRPGYVDISSDTEMTKDLVNTRLASVAITSEQCADDIARGIKNKKSYIVSPWIMTVVIWLSWLTPLWLINKVANYYLSPEAIEKRKKE